jgi:SAM-dependent methyltransferase
MLENARNRLSHWGFVYWSPALYRITMALLRPFGGRKGMYRYLAAQIGNQSVLELCCGDGELLRCLKGNRYTGIDINPGFVRAMHSKGHRVLQADVLAAEWPEAECLVMVDSLYHFMGAIQPFMKRVLEHPARMIILSESVEHIALRKERWLVRFIQWGTRVDGRAFPGRYTEESARRLLGSYGFQQVERLGSNLVGVLKRS